MRAPVVLMKELIERHAREQKADVSIPGGAITMNNIYSWPPEVKGIQCASMLRRVQDKGLRNNRMAEEGWHSLYRIQFLLPGEKEWSEYMPVFWQLHPFFAYLHLIVIVGKWKRSGVHSCSSDSRHLTWCVFPWHSGLLSPSVHCISSMAPRYRATPRRGRHQGQRSGAGRRGN